MSQPDPYREALVEFLAEVLFEQIKKSCDRPAEKPVKPLVSDKKKTA